MRISGAGPCCPPKWSGVNDNRSGEWRAKTEIREDNAEAQRTRSCTQKNKMHRFGAAARNSKSKIREERNTETFDRRNPPFANTAKDGELSSIVAQSRNSGKNRAGNLPRCSDHRQGFGGAGLFGKRQRNRVVSRPANGLTPFGRWLARYLYTVSLAWRYIRFASRRNAARGEQYHKDSGFCSRSTGSRITVSYGSDRGKRARAPERCSARNRSWSL